MRLRSSFVAQQPCASYAKCHPSQQMAPSPPGRALPSFAPADSETNSKPPLRTRQLERPNGWPGRTSEPAPNQPSVEMSALQVVSCPAAHSDNINRPSNSPLRGRQRSARTWGFGVGDGGAVVVVRVAPEPVHIRRRRPDDIHKAPVPRGRIAREVHRIVRVEDPLQRQAGPGLVAGAGPGDVGLGVRRQLQPRNLRLPARTVVLESLGSALWQCVLQTTRRSQDSLSLRNDEQPMRSKITAAGCGDVVILTRMVAGSSLPFAMTIV